MVEFMIIACPRSGTTWATNWLNTEKTRCYHDPLNYTHYRDLDSLPTKKILGIADTTLPWFPDWLNEHPARKVILDRNLDEINESLARECGMPPIAPEMIRRLHRIEGLHVNWTELFINPEPIWKHLVDMPFDKERHETLVKMNVQNIHAKEPVDIKVATKIMRELWGF